MADIYGLHQPYDKGYGVKHRNIDPNDSKYRHSRSAQFVNQVGEGLWFWIDEIEANFEIVGSTAQSRTTRQFYPHNMAQPSVTVTGTAPSNFFYNRMASFVRKAQVYSVTSPREVGLPDFRKVDIGGLQVPTPTITLRVLARHQKGAPNQRRHRSWRFEGYVKTIRAGGERANVAPTFTFEFIIAAATTNRRKNEPPLIEDSLIQGREILSWMDIFKSRGGKGWTQDPSASAKAPPKQAPSAPDNQYDTSLPLPNPLDPNPGPPFTYFGARD